MLSKKQKTIMAILGSVGILFGLIVAIPFRSFPGLNKIENILTIELINQISFRGIIDFTCRLPSYKKI